MHIIFLTHYFPPEVNAPATRTYENCKCWVESGHEVTVITGAPNMPDGVIYKGYKNKFFNWDEMNGIKILRVWTYIAPNRGIFRRTLNYISFMVSSLLGVFLIKNGDMVIATSPQFFCGIGGSFFSRIKRLPFILEVRDIWPDSIIAVGALTNRSLIRFFEKLEISLYRSAEKIIVVTESLKKIISHKGIPEIKIFVIKNGVDLSFFNPHNYDNKIRAELNLSGKFIVSYIGTIGMAHALDQVLRVAERLRSITDIVFLLVGSGATREILIHEKERKNLSNVIFIEKQPKNLVPTFYAASDACLVTLKKTPLFKGALPSKIFEIMAMAKPIILGIDGEAREVVEKAKAGIFFEPENEEQLEEVILRLYRNKQERQILGNNGRNFVKKYFNREKLANDYLKVLLYAN
ncbi:glycosyltransferase family 4 protein [candidate division WOR-3 bacterium]|nr:glycosyltransferase family 4 protein [candidate division WOR-3 bacterium]